MPTVKLRDGDVTLYTRGDSKNWYAGFRLPNGGRLQKSLKTRNKAEAKERAIAQYDDIKWRHKLGLSSKSVTFSHAATAWLGEIRAEVAAGSRKSRTVIDYEPVVDRYLNPFFEGREIEGIKQADISRYTSWRRDYWVTGDGSKKRTLEYDRDGKSVKRKVSHKKQGPSPRTINGENVVLRGIFKHALTQGWLTQDQIPKIANAELKTADSRKRAYPHFEQSEYLSLRRYMTKWVMEAGIKDEERWRREGIQDFVLILFNSGLREHELLKRDERSDELRGLRWRDVEFFTSEKGSPLAQLSVDGKTGKRHVIPLRAVRFVLERRKRRCPNSKPDDFVMSLPDGTVFSSFHGGIKRLLKSAGLLKDPKTGKNRGIYSCRHTYATGQLKAGRNTIDVARNMGTSLAMLEKSYFHFLAKDAADRLTGNRGSGR